MGKNLRIDNKLQGLALVVCSLVVAVVFIFVSASRGLSTLENTLLQLISLGLGVAGSFVLGREQSREDAKDMVKPHARSAFRRVLSLYNSLSRLASAIERQKLLIADDGEGVHALEKLEGIVVEQIATADDAMEDWKDILPEDLDRLKVAAKRELSLESAQHE